MNQQSYTKEEIIVAASFCKDLEDFKTRYQGIYEFIEGSDQLDKMFSYEPVTLNRAVYVFEFSNGTVYVGLSYNIQRRYRSHVTEGNSPVYNYIKTRPNIKFQFKQLSEYIPPDAAARLEIETIRDYRTKGWSMLNTSDGGGLGAGKRVVSRFFRTTEEIEPVVPEHSSFEDFFEAINTGNGAWFQEMCNDKKSSRIQFILRNLKASSIISTADLCELYNCIYSTNLRPKSFTKIAKLYLGKEIKQYRKGSQRVQGIKINNYEIQR